jgi:anti-sigma B factor antagonist
VGSAERGRHYDLTSVDSPIPEVDVALKLVLPEAIRDRADPPPAFACSWSWSHGGFASAVARVSGDLDIATAPRLEQTLRACLLQARRVVLDLHELAFIDSSGVHAIVTARVRARQDGRRLVLVRVPPHVHRVFTLTGNADHVEIGPDPVEPTLATPLQPRIRGNRFRRDATRLRAVAEPVSIEHETYDRLLRAIMDRGSTGERGPATPDAEDRRPR